MNPPNLRSLILCIGLLAIFCSCSRNTTSPNEERLQAERDSLLILANDNKSELDKMTLFFNEVASCIDSISEQEKILALSVNPETGQRYTTKEITARLNQLTGIINEQRKKIVSLVDSLHNDVDSTRITGLTSTVAYLTSQLEKKEQQITRLKAEISGQRQNIAHLTSKVEDLSTEINTLAEQNNVLATAVKEQTEIINEGYVLVASKNTLKEMGVIEGGGLLKRSKTNLNNVSINKCSKVNIATFTELPIPSKKAKLLSPAPSGSYKLTRTSSSTILTITNANAFWSLSNVLIIQTQ